MNMTPHPLSSEPVEHIGAVRVGCATWSIPQPGAVQFAGAGSHLQRYSQVLNCSEINSSFRRVHRAATWQRWASSVPPNFRFSVKMSRAITHDAKLKCSREVVMEFVQQIRSLNGRLGPLLLQTPPSLEFETKYVSNFFSLLRECYGGDVVCEPRHSSWFTDRADNCLKDFLVARVAAESTMRAGGRKSGRPADGGRYWVTSALCFRFSSVSASKIPPMTPNSTTSVKSR
jgi:uncharacterized protein YecE (DUF72 family)